jgi:hypothetical protein
MHRIGMASNVHTKFSENWSKGLKVEMGAHTGRCGDFKSLLSSHSGASVRQRTIATATRRRS